MEDTTTVSETMVGNGVGSNDTSDTTHSTQVHISVDAIKRIGLDVKNILKDPLDNIVYIHSTTSVNKGYAMVVGTSDTPYFCVPMFYSIEYPSDYPHSPPKMRFLTHSSPNGKSVRMHPNYYVNGKCCLSLLNSWSGDKWTGCQTLSSLLMTVLMTLTDNPLTNEPGYSRTHTKTHEAYRAVVTEAGLNWIAQFICGSGSEGGSGGERECSELTKSVVRFCSCDDENAELEQRFRSEFIAKFIKRDEYGGSLVKALREYSSDIGKNGNANMYQRFINGYDDTTHFVGCYTSEYKVEFTKTRDLALMALEKWVNRVNE